jgi:hypothetical protein
MKKVLIFVLSVFLFTACQNENENTMYVKGSIKGLKKGTLYLQKQIDSFIVSVDSVNVNGTQEFLLTDIVLSPEMYFLTLGKSEKKIAFFGEKDTINISSNLEKFILKAKITGSKNQELLDKFLDIKKKFNNKNLDLIKEEFEARKTGVQDSIDLVTKKLKNLNRRKYLYTTNFAVNNSDFEVAPYVALTELINANIKLLDTINKALSPEVKNSKYGKQLEKFVSEIKLQENQQ